MKKKNILFGIMALMLFSLIGSVLAGTFTITRPADNTYSNNGTIVIAITYVNGSAPTGLINATNMTIRNNANGSWEVNGTYSTTANHGLNGSLVNFSVKITADRTMTWQVTIYNNSGSQIEISSNFTYYYDTTAPTLVQTPTTSGSKVTVTYTPTDTLAASNCSIDGGASSSVTSGTEYSYDKIYQEQNDAYSISTTCNDRAGNSVSGTSTFGINFGGSAPATTTYTTPQGQPATQEQIAEATGQGMSQNMKILLIIIAIGVVVYFVKKK